MLHCARQWLAGGVIRRERSTRRAMAKGSAERRQLGSCGMAVSSMALLQQYIGPIGLAGSKPSMDHARWKKVNYSYTGSDAAGRLAASQQR